MTAHNGPKERERLPLHDSVPLLLKKNAPNPELTLRVDGVAGTMGIEYLGAEIASVPFDRQTVYSLPSLCEKKENGLLEGLRLEISEQDLKTPLGFEVLLHVVMINVVSCIHPRISFFAPARNTLPIHAFEAEENYIRNAPHFHEYNHLNLFAGSMKGLPLLMALPGPSLDFDYIREHRSKFILMGVGRAVGKLLEADITPDILYIQDVNTNAWDLNLGSLGDRRIPSLLIANPLGRIWEYRHNFERIIKAWNLYPFEYDEHPRIDEIPPSSVSGAFSLAKLLGFKSIMFLGNDCGSPAPRLEENGFPESVTNLPYTRNGELLVFEPTAFIHDIRISYGDISAQTKSDYLCGAQWLKGHAAKARAEGGPELYDRSHTRLTQLNSSIRDASSYEHGPDVTMRPLPRFLLKYDAEKYLKNKRNSYSLIARQLRTGKVPNMSLQKPFSTIYCNTDMARYDTTTPAEGDIETALRNAERLIEHAEIALGELD